MNSDFVFINPNKIPPRRAANSGGASNASSASGKLKIRKTKPLLRPYAADEENLENEADLSFDLLGESPPEIRWAGFERGPVDPLTEAIFGERRILRQTKPGWSRSLPADSARWAGAGVSLTQKGPIPREYTREKILAELENINQSDAELAKKFQRAHPPRRVERAGLVAAPEVAPEPRESFEIKLNIAPSPAQKHSFGSDLPQASRDQSERDRFRAEDDWFQISLAAPERLFELGKLARGRWASPQSEEAKTEQELSAEGRFKLRTYLAVFFALLAPLSAGVFLFSGRDNFVASAFSNFNSKLLSTASFTLVNSEENSVFPKLVEINSQLKASGFNQPVGHTAEFIEANDAFSWLNLFKKKANLDPVSPSTFRLKSVESLETAKSILFSPVAAQESLNQPRDDLNRYVGWLNFWNRLVAPEKHYLIAVFDSGRAWPGGGRLENYALVKVEDGGLETLGSGKFSALDAALNLKIAPPDPVRLASTAWLPSQSLWFLDFKESAQTLINFFENTTQKKIDGVLAADKIFLKKLSFKESLLYDPDSAGWFYGLAEALARKPASRWPGLAEYLEKGLAAHEVQFYFKDAAMEKFAAGSGWALAAESAPQGDVLGISRAALEGGGPDLELVEYKINVFEDGSVMANLSLLLKQSISSPGLSYFKIHLPKGSQVLKAAGFSSPQKLPDFDYAAGGFSFDDRVGYVSAGRAANGPGHLDIFEETGLAVAAGWVDFKSGARNTLNLEYLLPFKLPRQKALADYRLKIFRPHQNQNTPIRFIAVSKKNVHLASLEPNGFVTENLGEYQGSLARDLDLTATFIFGE